MRIKCNKHFYFWAENILCMLYYASANVISVYDACIKKMKVGIEKNKLKWGYVRMNLLAIS